jgi:hypothetical protein
MCHLTGYELDGPGSIPSTAQDFSFLCSVQTGSGAHSASYTMSAGSKAAGA